MKSSPRLPSLPVPHPLSDFLSRYAPVSPPDEHQDKISPTPPDALFRPKDLHPISRPFRFPAAQFNSTSIRRNKPLSKRTKIARPPLIRLERTKPNVLPIPQMPDFTGIDSTETFPLVLDEAIEKKTDSIDSELEVILGKTLRQSLTEYSSEDPPIEPPKSLTRLIWRLQALFTSGTYEEIFFEKTQRFQVEEVFVLDPADLSLVSHARTDDSLHFSSRKVVDKLEYLANQARDAHGKIRPAFKLSNGRNVVSHQGKFVTLLAIIQGRPNEMTFANLSSTLGRLEACFRERLQTKGSSLLQILQPLLEDSIWLRGSRGKS